MVNHQYFDLFQKGSVDKQWKIEYEGGIITNEELFSQSIEIKESLCSETELRFGSCETSSLKFKIANVVQPLIGKWLALSVVLDHHEESPIPIGEYKVDSDKLTSDRMHREIIAYDSMYDIIHADVSAWYNSMFPEEDKPKGKNDENEEDKLTLKEFRESFIRYFGLEEVVPEGGLVNDEMEIEKTISVIASESSESETSQKSVIGEVLSGMDVITSICEINGCFGHIGRDGKFHYIYLQQSIEGLYPSNKLYPSNTLFPREPKGSRIGGGTYIDIQWENYIAKSITKLQIRQEENDIGLIYGDGDNCYTIQGNFLVFGKSSKDLRVIADNIYGKISRITYIPLIKCEASGNPCFEVGDPIRMSTKYKIVETYILERTLSGVQALRDTYKANGTEEYSEKVNGVHSSILQIKGMANILERTIEMTRLQMINIEAGLSTEIKVTASGLLAEVSAHYETKDEAYAFYTDIESSISLQSGRITSEIERATTIEERLWGQINTTEKTFTSKIEQTESRINMSVSKSIEETKNESKEYADAQVKIATDNINLSINQKFDMKLRDYSTTEQMTSAIGIATNNIDLSISQRFDTKLKDYSTTKEVNSAISIATNAINMSVDNKIQEVRTYTDGQVDIIYDDIEGELKKYSTTTQMNAAIKAATDEINLSVNSYVQETKTYVDTQTAEVTSATDEKLKSYSTTTQMNSAINIKANEITTSVSSTYETQKNAEKIYEQLRASISVNETDIALKVSKTDYTGAYVASLINQSADSVVIQAKHIKLEGTVTANNYFKINTDGSMECNDATIKNATITNGTINNATITNGTISNAAISEGTINKATITNGTVTDASITNGTITNATCTNLDVQSGKIGAFTISDTALTGTSTNGDYTAIGISGYRYAFSVGRSGTRLAYIDNSGYQFTNNNIDAGGYMAGDYLVARHYSATASGNINYVKIGGASGTYGYADFYYSNTFRGDVKAFGDALEVLSNKDLALHAGSNNNFIHLYNDTKYYGTFAAASARKYKNNITPISDMDAEAIMHLNPMEFDYISNGMHSCGLIADDAYKYLPQIVILTDGEPDSIDYIRLIPFMLRKMQMQDEIIKEMRNNL